VNSTIYIDAVPAALRERDQWVCWKYLPPTKPGGKSRKVPFQINGELAKSDDAATWTSFDDVTRAWREGGFDGVGFVFSEDDPFTGIDLDDCIVDGQLIPSAQGIVHDLNTYTEVSPSGQGLKMIVLGRKPEGAGCKKLHVDGIPCVEVYDTGRYFTITGRRWEGTPADIGDRQEQLDALCNRLWPPKQRTVSHPGRVGVSQPVAMDERERRCRAYLDKCHDAISGQAGHDKTLRAACECFRFDLDEAAAWGVMRWFNDTKTGGEPWTDKELAHKIDSAREKVAASGEVGIRLRARGVAPLRSDLQREAQQLTDVGNAARLLLKHGQDLRYSVARGEWLIWDGKRWRPDDRKRIVKLCKETALSILDEAKRADDTRRDDLMKWARASQKKDRITAMAALAEPEVAVGPDDLDTDPWLFNCKSGTIDLRSGELQPHRREDLITKLAPVEYDPDAACPRFMRFLDEIFDNDQDLIGFVQRWLGHCLTGDITEQILPIFWGEGNNGKSVLLDTSMALMGDYAGVAPPDLLVVRKHQEHPTEYADLMGKRLVVASESERGAELRLQLVKRLTGDATIKGRYMRMDYFEFARTHKTILVTNNRPEVKEDTDAAWRRLRLVPFTVVIRPEKRDKHLMKALRTEWPGILAWMVRGCLDWQHDGLAEPEKVIAATAAYRGVSNSVKAFLDECCTCGDGLFVPAKDLLASYAEWCAREGVVPLKGKEWGAALKSQGCQPKKLFGARHWVGIELCESPEDGSDGFDTNRRLAPSGKKVAVHTAGPVKSDQSVNDPPLRHREAVFSGGGGA
jgi:putative DNA primase/helicase